MPPVDAIHIQVIDQPNRTLETLVDATLQRNFNVNLPPYCSIPGNNSYVLQERKKLLEFLETSLTYQCPDASFTCRRAKTINPLTPCLSDIARAMTEDYAWSKNWCRVVEGLSDIPTLQHMESATERLSRYLVKKSQNNSLLFCIFVHEDFSHLKRFFRQIYSLDHLYVIMVDKISVSLYKDIESWINGSFHDNVAVVAPEHIIYKTSSISQLTARFLVWSLKHIPNWDYVIYATGADYPLMSLKQIEQNLAASNENNRLPKLLAWGWSPNAATLDNFSETAVHGLSQMFKERQSLSPLRANHHFGIPLTCGGDRLYMRFSNRIASKASSPKRYDTQVLKLLKYLISLS